MTIPKVKLGKISIVVFLTALIWVWADLAQDDSLLLSNVVVQMAKSTDPALWACFLAEHEGAALQVTLDSVTLKGPARRVADVKRRQNRGDLDLSLFVSPEREGMTKTGVQTLEVLKFLKDSDEVRQLGVTVVDCEPKRLTVRVQELVKTSVPVECTGLDPTLQVKTLVPDTVQAFVPKEPSGPWKAIIRQWAPDEQVRAKNVPVDKIPYIELAPGLWQPLAKVKVTLTPAESSLSDGVVSAVLGFCFSQNVQGHYRVVLCEDNDPTKLAKVLIRATTLAQDAYTKTIPQMILYIHDEDRQATEPISREVVFNFPQDYVRSGEIWPNQQPPTVRFRLEAIPDKAATSP